MGKHGNKLKNALVLFPPPAVEPDVQDEVRAAFRTARAVLSGVNGLGQEIIAPRRVASLRYPVRRRLVIMIIKRSSELLLRRSRISNPVIIRQLMVEIRMSVWAFIHFLFQFFAGCGRPDLKSEPRR